MTTSTGIFRIRMRSRFPMATRLNGMEAREYLLAMLREHDVVVLDFENSAPTPSFADECVGRLAQTLGFGSFKSRIRMANVPNPAKPLIKHVVMRRTREVAVP